MLYSKLFGKTNKSAPRGAKAISHKLLMQGGYIDRALAPGVYSFLPLGLRTFRKIENIIRQEMNNIGGQEILLPTLQPKTLWEETDRWDNMDPPLFKLRDRHKKELALGPTHEEVITDLIRKFIHSYRDLPIYLYQIQNKFRNEMRSTGGLLRTREFMMKDLYSFHKNGRDLNNYFSQVEAAYFRIFSRCGLSVVEVEASGGTIGGSQTKEFIAISETGEDKIVFCPHCQWGANLEKGDKYYQCPHCRGKIEKKKGIEVGHVFKLGTRYSGKMKANFVDKDDKRKPFYMGCYGIGLGRLMATIVEIHHNKKGIIWPQEVAPFDVHLVSLEGTSQKNKKVYQRLINDSFEVLYDNRVDVSAGEKFADADLIGSPVRLVISKKTGDAIEWKYRQSDKAELLQYNEVVKKLKTEK